MNRGRIKYGLDLSRSLFFLIGSILFTGGAIGFCADPENKRNNWVYLGCAVSYLSGSLVDIATYFFQPEPTLPI